MEKNNVEMKQLAYDMINDKKSQANQDRLSEEIT
jgi:hypothetical protein